MISEGFRVQGFVFGSSLLFCVSFCLLDVESFGCFAYANLLGAVLR